MLTTRQSETLSLFHLLDTSRFTYKLLWVKLDWEHCHIVARGGITCALKRITTGNCKNQKEKNYPPPVKLNLCLHTFSAYRDIVSHILLRLFSRRAGSAKLTLWILGRVSKVKVKQVKLLGLICTIVQQSCECYVIIWIKMTKKKSLIKHLFVTWCRATWRSSFQIR